MADAKPYPTEEKEPLALNDVDPSLTYSYANYLTWLFDERVEIIKGKIFPMSPAPSRSHQEVSASLTAALFVF
ncbi:Uma2 family endonuclease [Hufsiella arboris]|uniref:Uma2 family endonuclease n=1 Tax=Hufsiella arboris TaxID=2695275 RepID=UPI001F2BBA47|nr:Uma2 family endonuclease [Hufsiella arboris]